MTIDRLDIDKRAPRLGYLIAISPAKSPLFLQFQRYLNRVQAIQTVRAQLTKDILVNWDADSLSDTL